MEKGFHNIEQFIAFITPGHTACHNQINMNYIEKNAPNTEPIGILYPVRCRLFNLSDSNAHRHYNLDAW